MDEGLEVVEEDVEEEGVGAEIVVEVVEVDLDEELQEVVEVDEEDQALEEVVVVVAALGVGGDKEKEGREKKDSK